MTEIKLTKRYPQSRTEDIVDAYMRGWNDALDAVQNGKFHIAEHTEPKCGEWIAKTENCHSHWVCSKCGAWALLEYNEQMCLSNFCPNCGARMKGADDE